MYKFFIVLFQVASQETIVCRFHLGIHQVKINTLILQGVFLAFFSNIVNFRYCHTLSLTLNTILSSREVAEHQAENIIPNYNIDKIRITEYYFLIMKNLITAGGR